MLQRRIQRGCLILNKREKSCFNRSVKATLFYGLVCFSGRKSGCMRSYPPCGEAGGRGTALTTVFLLNFLTSVILSICYICVLSGVVEGVIITNYYTDYAVVPSTIPPEYYCENYFITRDKYTENTSFIGEWSPSLRAEARKEDRLRFTTTSFRALRSAFTALCSPPPDNRQYQPPRPGYCHLQGGNCLSAPYDCWWLVQQPKRQARQ